MSTQLSFGDTQTAEPKPMDELQFENDFIEIKRVDLDENSWIEVVPGLLRSPENLFARLLREFSWSQRQRWMYDSNVDEPRLTASYPQIAEAPNEALRTLARRLSQVYGVTYDGLWVNLYRDHRDSTSWHGDTSPASETSAPSPSSPWDIHDGSSSSHAPEAKARRSHRPAETFS
jgi:hypothetical protein